jgi:hypothetical protein
LAAGQSDWYLLTLTQVGQLSLSVGSPGGNVLPTRLTLATPEELNDLFTQPVAMLGYPGCDQQAWPAAGETPQASFRGGIVNRLASLKACGNRNSREPQLVQHSISSWFGSSGAPVFLPNGHVVAINAGARVMQHDGVTAEQPYGIRADCLWELIAYHHLADQLLIPVSEASLNLDRYGQVDDYEMRCHTAMALVNECDRSMLNGDFSLAKEKCDQALSLVRDTDATAWASKSLELAPMSRKARIRQELAAYSSAASGLPWTSCMPPQTFGPEGGSGLTVGTIGSRKWSSADSTPRLVSDPRRPLFGGVLNDHN